MPTSTRKQHLSIGQSAAESRPAAGSEYDRQLQVAQTQLEKLQQQREEIEQKRLEAEELNQRRQLFLDGQLDLLSKFDNSVHAIDREIFEMRQELQDLEEARKTFASNLQTLQAIDPKKWRKTKLSEDVENAIHILERCEEDYEEIADSIESGRKRGIIGASSKSTPDSFAQTFRQGLAFNLPVLIFALIALIVILTN
ncbi:MAG: hypothetical protein AAGC74_08120 [Verrucomicrobiota bacterium]